MRSEKWEGGKEHFQWGGEEMESKKTSVINHMGYQGKKKDEYDSAFIIISITIQQQLPG